MQLGTQSSPSMVHWEHSRLVDFSDGEHSRLLDFSDDGDLDAAFALLDDVELFRWGDGDFSAFVPRLLDFSGDANFDEACALLDVFELFVWGDGDLSSFVPFSAFFALADLAPELGDRLGDFSAFVPFFDRDLGDLGLSVGGLFGF